MRIKSINMVSIGIACLSLFTFSQNVLAAGAPPSVPLPEPSILGLLGIGVVVMALVRIKRK